MNGEHAEFELLDGYALGTLSKADAERVRSHVALCERCRAELGELRSVADVLPFTLEGTSAPAHLRDRILARIDEPAPPPRSRRRWYSPSAVTFGSRRCSAGKRRPPLPS
jgi:putative transcriptional regulator